MTIAPRMAFENLFGEGGTPEERAARQAVNRSILDWISQDVARLQKDLGPNDKRRLRARAARCPAGRARFLRRAPQTHVRSAGACLHDRYHACVLVQDEPRRK